MPKPKRRWTLLSNHGLALFHVAANPSSTLREIAEALGITERQVVRIMKDLVEVGMVQVDRQGRRNCYSINSEARLRHPMLSHVMVGKLLEALAPSMARLEAMQRGS